MAVLSIEDFKLRLFVDTNVLIDAIVTPEQPVVDFLNLANGHEEIDLVTSDYVLWEQNEFIRMQTWIKQMVDSNKSYKNAIKWGITVDDSLQELVTNRITKSSQDRETLNIYNYNLMDDSIATKDFFSLTSKLTAFTAISNKDLLILLSAYATRSHAILSSDKNFRSEFSNAVSLKASLRDSLLPVNLKEIKFFKPRPEAPPSVLYYQWFTDFLAPRKVGKCEAKVYERMSIVAIRCENDEVINIGDYLMIAKISPDQFRKQVVKVETGNLKDYESTNDIEGGRHVTLKIPDAPENTIDWMANAMVFKISDATS